MSLRFSLLLLISSLVACGGASHDEGSESDTKAELIPPAHVEGNFQNLPPELQSSPITENPPPANNSENPPASVEPSQPKPEAKPTPKPKPIVMDDEEDQRYEYKPAPKPDEKSPVFAKPEEKPPVFQAPPADEKVVQPPPAPSSPDSRVAQPAPPAPAKPQPPAPPKTAIPKPAAEGLSALESELLRLLNEARAKKGIAPLRFSRLQSKGTATCVGSQGHSEHMASTRRMSHDQFPNDICLRTMASSENVGYATGDATRAIRVVHKLMMDEGPGDPNHPNHYDNIMNPTYNTVGLGFYYTKDRTLWITENFLRL